MKKIKVEKSKIKPEEAYANVVNVLPLGVGSLRVIENNPGLFSNKKGEIFILVLPLPTEIGIEPRFVQLNKN